MRNIIINVFVIMLLCIGSANGQHLNLISTIDTLGVSRSICIDGDYAYLCCDSVGLVIFNISDPIMPSAISYFETPTDALDISIQGDYAFLLDYSNGVYVLDVNNPETPVLITQFNFNRVNEKIVVKDNLVYIAGIYENRSNVIIIDISNIYNPQLLCAIAGGANDIYVDDELAYISYGFCENSIGCIGSFGIYDMSNPSIPNRLVLYNTDSLPCRSIVIEDDIAYVGVGGRWLFTYNSELLIIDVSDPENPFQISNLFFGTGQTHVIRKRSDYIFMIFETIFAPTFYAVNIADPNYPSIISEDMVSNPLDIVTQNNLLFFAGWPSLEIYRCDLLTESDDNIQINPEQIEFSQNYPNPFNASTTIQYSLAEKSDITITVYDILGRNVGVLYDGVQGVGEYRVVWDSRELPSGIYYYGIQTSNYREYKRMLLLK